MKQRFSFPHTVGRPSKVTYVNVTPQYEATTSNGQQAVTGIYHVQVELILEQGEGEREGVLIEEMDLDGAVGYFEYALPLALTFEGNQQIASYQLDEIEAKVLANGVLEIQAKELIERVKLDKQTNLTIEAPVADEAIVQNKTEQHATSLSESTIPNEGNEDTVSVTYSKEQNNQKSNAASIVNWLKLSKGFHKEMIVLNPVLKKQVSDET